MRFPVILLITVLLALTGLAGFNRSQDPTGILALTRDQASPCGMQTDRRWTMPLVVDRAPATAIMSGTSRMLHGFAENDLEDYFGQSPVLNASLPVMTVDELRWLLAAPLAKGQYRHALLGIEYEMFRSRFPGLADSLGPGTMRWRTIKNPFQVYVSQSASSASWQAYRDGCPKGIATATGFPPRVQPVFFSTPDSEGHLHASEKVAQSHASRFGFNEQRYQDALSSFTALLAAGCQGNVQMDLLIPPSHLRMERIAHALGITEESNRWKRDITGIVSDWQETGCALRLFDFEAYNQITTSPFLRADGAIERNVWYYEPSHFTPKTGHCLLASLQGNPRACTKTVFGKTLEPGMLNVHLEKLQAQLERNTVKKHAN